MNVRHTISLFLMISMDFFVPSINVLFSRTIITGTRNKMNPRIISKTPINNPIIRITGSGINVNWNLEKLNIEKVTKHTARKSSIKNMDLYLRSGTKYPIIFSFQKVNLCCPFMYSFIESMISGIMPIQNNKSKIFLDSCINTTSKYCPVRVRSLFV